jgi:hypothetical protein
MDYYEELGLSPSATEEDIHKAFRTMSRVLHPDLQNDPATRDAAALQMRRLNAIVDILLDPKRRQEYNRTLRAAPMGPVAVYAQGPAYLRNRRHNRLPGWLRTPAAGVALIVVAGVLFTLGAVWFEAGDLIHFQSSSQRPATVEPTPAPPTPPASPTVTPGRTMDTKMNSAPAREANHRDRREVPALVEARNTTLPPPPEPAPQAVSEPQAQAAAATSREGAPAPPPPAAPAPGVSAPTPESPAAPGLEGFWVYAPEEPRAQRAPTLYAPEFIQLRIRAQDDHLYGEYSARYFVSDRPISSEVSFTFQGKAGASGSFGWRADDGSLGIVDLKMLSTQSLQVNWRVTSFGSHMGLSAGTAVLIRKLPS